MSEKLLAPAWTTRPERGSMRSIKLGVAVALGLKRRLARLFLYPICLYFLASSPEAVCASRGYLARVLGRRPRLADIFRHFLNFAACLLDRVFLLNEQLEQFDITVYNEALVRDIEAQGGGCILLGAHFGSFEAARAIGRQRRGLPVSLLMYEENAKKIRAALAAINPRLATEVIGLGRLDSLITVSQRLSQGHFIGVLADRDLDGKDLVRLDFLGAPAAFPQGPFRVAALLQRPVVLMVGIYRGGARYEVVFESLAEAPEARLRDEPARIEAMMQAYAARLEHYCREAPYNWANFYDFWA